MKKVLFILSCVAITGAITAQSYAVKVTINNQTQEVAHVELKAKGHLLKDTQLDVAPNTQKTVMSTENCYRKVEVRLGDALVFGRRSQSRNRNLCGEHMIQIVPDNSKNGFHIDIKQ